jgi:hypothetical protein
MTLAAYLANNSSPSLPLFVEGSSGFSEFPLPIKGQVVNFHRDWFTIRWANGAEENFSRFGGMAFNLIVK